MPWIFFFILFVLSLIISNPLYFFYPISKIFLRSPVSSKKGMQYIYIDICFLFMIFFIPFIIVVVCLVCVILLHLCHAALHLLGAGESKYFFYFDWKNWLLDFILSINQVQIHFYVLKYISILDNFAQAKLTCTAFSANLDLAFDTIVYISVHLPAFSFF